MFVAELSFGEQPLLRKQFVLAHVTFIIGKAACAALFHFVLLRSCRSCLAFLLDMLSQFNWAIILLQPLWISISLDAILALVADSLQQH